MEGSKNRRGRNRRDDSGALRGRLGKAEDMCEEDSANASGVIQC